MRAALVAVLVVGCADATPDAKAPTEVTVEKTRSQPIAVDERASEPRASSPFTWLPCNAERTVRSLVADTSLEMVVRNETRVPLVMTWLDYDGNRVDYAQVEPGEEYLQQTYVTHPWIVRAGTRCVGLFVPQAAGHHDLVLRALPLRF